MTEIDKIVQGWLSACEEAHAGFPVRVYTETSDDDGSVTAVVVAVHGINDLQVFLTVQSVLEGNDSAVVESSIKTGSVVAKFHPEVIALADSYRRQLLALLAQKACWQCHGKGVVCPACRVSGHIASPSPSCAADLSCQASRKCEVCNGSGYIRPWATVVE